MVGNQLQITTYKTQTTRFTCSCWADMIADLLRIGCEFLTVFMNKKLGWFGFGIER